MYQLQDPNSDSYRSKRPFLDHQIQQQGPVQNRACTDIFCLILFILFVGAFIGIMIYALVAGTPLQALYVHNFNGVACNTQPNFPHGYFIVAGSTDQAICVSQCPKNSQTVACLTDGKYCLNGTFTAPSQYSTFNILYFCVPDPSIGNRSLSQYFDYNIIIQWIFDIETGYLIIIGAAVAAIIVSLIYSCLLRCITGCLLYTSLAIIQIICIGIGILLILQGSGVQFTKQLPINLARLSQIQLYITGGVLIAFAVIFLIVIICLCSRIQLGVKVVQTAAIFLSQRFYMSLMPIISALFFFATIAALLVGGLYLYGTGQRTLPTGNAFYMVNFNAGLIIMFVVYAFAGFWMICWIFYSNTFVVMSAASIWYYQHDSPLCTSFFRLLRYHTGSIAFASLLFGLFFILRMIAKFFHLRNQNSQNKCFNVCMQIGTLCLCVFDQILKFLSQGIFVQIAIKSTNYCVSTLQAFKILTHNPIKITISGVISFMVFIFGVLFIMGVVCTAAYFIQLYVTYFAQILTDPIPMTVMSGFVVAIISGIYLSVLVDSSQAIIQCYLIDQIQSKAKGLSVRFAPDHLKLILEDHIA